MAFPTIIDSPRDFTLQPGGHFETPDEVNDYFSMVKIRHNCPVRIILGARTYRFDDFFVGQECGDQITLVGPPLSPLAISDFRLRTNDPIDLLADAVNNEEVARARYACVVECNGFAGVVGMGKAINAENILFLGGKTARRGLTTGGPDGYPGDGFIGRLSKCGFMGFTNAGIHFRGGGSIVGNNNFCAHNWDDLARGIALDMGGFYRDPAFMAFANESYNARCNHGGKLYTPGAYYGFTPSVCVGITNGDIAWISGKPKGQSTIVEWGKYGLSGSGNADAKANRVVFRDNSYAQVSATDGASFDLRYSTITSTRPNCTYGISAIRSLVNAQNLAAPVTGHRYDISGSGVILSHPPDAVVD